jgi:anti-anti-sigma factor
MMTITLPRPAAPIPLRIQVCFTSPDSVRVAVAGEVDLATAPILGMRLLTVIDAHRPAVIDVDLAEVGFLDCSGIGVLVAVRNAAETSRCQVWVSQPQPIVATVLEVLGLLAMFTAPTVSAGAPPPRPALARTTRTRVVRMARALAGRVAA